MVGLSACADGTPRSAPAPDGPTASESAREGEIVIHVDRPGRPFDDRLLGTNVPAWLGPERLADPALIDRAIELGATVMRMPGGSWSNHYDWEACENSDPDRCYWTWAARPTDFLDFLQATGSDAMWTVSANGTAQEAAALVAFFNGEVDDQQVIGVDTRGRDWGTVGDWAALRVEHGNPDPHPILLWEVGNELYGATSDAGPECAEFGWEDVWTCDGTEYVEGVDAHDGYLEVREAMRSVDPRIAVGAVGVPDPESWGDWGNEVLEAAGDELDFYVIHHYAFDTNPSLDKVLGVPRSTWRDVVEELSGRVEAIEPNRSLPLAVTEHNLVAVIDGDPDALMSTAANALYLAESIGQMAESGITLANQWNLANGAAASGADYGLVDVDTFEPYPAYYGLAAWQGFGDELLEVSMGFDPAVLSVYAGRSARGVVRVVVINKSGAEASAEIDVGAVAATVTGAWSARAPSLDATELELVVAAPPPGPGPWSFPPWSITSLTLKSSSR